MIGPLRANRFRVQARATLSLGLLYATASAALAQATCNDSTPRGGVRKERQTMVMLTPTPLAIKPSSFEHAALFENVFELRPTVGTVLRITADIGSIWIAFLFGWLVVERHDLA